MGFTGLNTKQTIILAFQLNDTVDVDNIQFSTVFARSGLGSEASRHFAVPIGGTIYQLAVSHDDAQAVNVQTIIMRVNGSDSALTLDIPIGSATVTFDLVNRVRVERGDIITLSFDSPLGSTSAEVESFAMLMDIDSP